MQAETGTVEDNSRYVRSDKTGAMRVGTGRVLLDGVVAAFAAGHPAETIREQYPALSLEEVYGAIAFYLANRDAVDAYLAQQATRWATERRKAQRLAAPVVKRLRAQQRRASAR